MFRHDTALLPAYVEMCDVAYSLLRYMVQILEQQQKQGKPLRPIIPLILYQGVQEWAVARSLRELVAGPDELLAYTPDCVCHLIDLGRYHDDELPQDEMTQATLLLMKYVARAELQDRFRRVFFLLQKLRDQPDGLENLRAFLKYVSLCSKQLDKRELRIQIETAFGRQGIDIMGTIAEEWVEDGRQEGLEKGLEKGRIEGLRTGVQAIVELRFPEDAATITTRLEPVDSAERLSEVLKLSRTVTTIDELVAFIDQRQS